MLHDLGVAIAILYLGALVLLIISILLGLISLVLR